MDVFFYWKDLADDLESGRNGRFRSTKEKLSTLQAGFPDFIWVFRTPKGKKGQLQLLAKVRWTSKAPAGFKPGVGESYMYHDPDDVGSVCFDDSHQDGPMAAVSTWARTHFPAAVNSNFQGQNGQHEMRGSVLFQLREIAATLPTRPFREFVPTVP